MSMELSLEKLKFDNPEEVHGLWSDEEATLFTNFPFLPTVEDCQLRLTKMSHFYGKRSDHFGPFSVRSPDGSFLGLTGADAGEGKGEFEIWYFIHRRMWGKKVATTAVSSLLNLMEASGRVDSISARVVIDNKASWRFLEGLGFNRVSTLPNSHEKNGVLRDCYVYRR